MREIVIRKLSYANCSLLKHFVTLHIVACLLWSKNVTYRRHWGTVRTVCHVVPARQDSLHCVLLEDWRRLCWPAQIAKWIPPKWELFTRTLWSVLRHCLHDTAQREMCLLPVHYSLVQCTVNECFSQSVCCHCWTEFHYAGDLGGSRAGSATLWCFVQPQCTRNIAVLQECPHQRKIKRRATMCTSMTILLARHLQQQLSSLYFATDVTVLCTVVGLSATRWHCYHNSHIFQGLKVAHVCVSSSSLTHKW